MNNILIIDDLLEQFKNLFNEFCFKIISQKKFYFSEERKDFIQKFQTYLKLIESEIMTSFLFNFSKESQSKVH